MSMIGYFKTNFNMITHHNWSLDSIESMIPWERDIYVILLNQYIEEENQRISKENGEMQSMKSRSR